MPFPKRKMKHSLLNFRVKIWQTPGRAALLAFRLVVTLLDSAPCGHQVARVIPGATIL